MTVASRGFGGVLRRLRQNAAPAVAVTISFLLFMLGMRGWLTRAMKLVLCVSIEACTSGSPGAGPPALTDCPVTGSVNIELNADPHTFASACPDGSAPTLELAVSWSSDGGGTVNGSPARNVQCADGSIAGVTGCPPSLHPVPVECLSGSCPAVCSITLWHDPDDASIGSLGIVSQPDGAPQSVWVQQGSCVYDRSFP
jgi:hypothetical protein